MSGAWGTGWDIKASAKTKTSEKGQKYVKETYRRNYLAFLWDNGKLVGKRANNTDMFTIV